MFHGLQRAFIKHAALMFDSYFLLPFFMGSGEFFFFSIYDTL